MPNQVAPPEGFSPQTYARIAGVLYLIIIGAGVGGEMFLRGPMIVSGNAAATAQHIVASPSLWRASIAGDLLMHICDVGVWLILYVLLRPVSRHLALLALLFDLVQTSVAVANKLNLLLPLFLLADTEYLKAFTPEQLQALSYVSLRAHSYGFGFALIFFGLACIVVGYLIVQSTYLPRVLGFLMQLAGVCYLVNSFALLLAPSVASRLSPAILLPPFVAESAVALWLLLKGVNLARWTERTTAAAA
jgi:hypothetical protein